MASFTCAMTALTHGLPVAREKWQRFNDPRLELTGETKRVCRTFSALPYLQPVPYVFDAEDLTATDWFSVPAGTPSAPVQRPGKS
jgi:hypothetical protein